MAGILDRVSLLIRSNVNDLLDRSEDPEKTINQIIRDMAEAIQSAESQVAETIAQKNLVEANLETARKHSDQWGSKAELAVKRGSDDLAREALRRRKDYLANAEVYSSQLVSQTEITTKLKSDLLALKSKYEDIVRTREVLIARHKMARAQTQVNKTAKSLSGIDPTSELSRMEDKIRLEEARAKAGAEVAGLSLDNRFAELENDDNVEDDLAALKAKVSPPALRPGN